MFTEDKVTAIFCMADDFCRMRKGYRQPISTLLNSSNSRYFIKKGRVLLEQL